MTEGGCPKTHRMMGEGRAPVMFGDLFVSILWIDLGVHYRFCFP